jgi:hypothetical protein
LSDLDRKSEVSPIADFRTWLFAKLDRTKEWWEAFWRLPLARSRQADRPRQFQEKLDRLAPRSAPGRRAIGSPGAPPRRAGPTAGKRF